jgi:hypothetical protein
MVDASVGVFHCSSFIPRIVTERSEESRNCYDELKLQLIRTLLERKSGLETIKMLQEDDNGKWTGCKHESVAE